MSVGAYVAVILYLIAWMDAAIGEIDDIDVYLKELEPSPWKTKRFISFMIIFITAFWPIGVSYNLVERIFGDGRRTED